MYTIQNKIRQLIRTLGYDVRQRRPELIDFLNTRRVNLALMWAPIPVSSAHCCEPTAILDRSFPSNRHRPFYDLIFRTAKDPKWTAQKLALGEHPGRALLNVSKFNTFSSLLSQTANAAAFEKNSAVCDVELIHVVRLDDACKFHPSDRFF